MNVFYPFFPSKLSKEAKTKLKVLSLLSFFSGPLTKESLLWEEILEKEQQVKTIPTMHDYLKATTKNQCLIKGY
jgi:hypothetical protein